MTTQHEGWKNYATWLVQLYVDNDEPLYRERLQLASEARRKYAGMLVPELRNRFAEDLAAWFDEMIPWGVKGVWHDLVKAALADVDWREIAETWLAEE